MRASRTVLLAMVGAILLAAAAPTALAAPAPRFFERTVAVDPEGDYDHNGALDIVAIHLAERFRYSQASRSGQEVVEFRIQLRERDQAQQLPPETTNGSWVTYTPIEYTLGYTVGSQVFEHRALLIQSCEISADEDESGLICPEPAVTAPHYSTGSGGFTFVLNRTENNLPVGTPISHVWAASALVSQGETTYHDTAPRDNEGRPEGAGLAIPSTDAQEHALEGTYPFLRGRLLSDAQPFSTPGGTAAFVMEIHNHENLSGIDRVFIDASGPAGWTFEGNYGLDFMTTAGGQRTEYELRVKVPAIATIGEVANIVIDGSLLGAGGHFQIPVQVSVASGKVDSPAFVFEEIDPRTHVAEEPSRLSWRIVHEGQPLANYEVAADFLLNGQVVDAKITAVEGEPGEYAAAYTFASGGAWSVDVYVSELKPSPHATFDVQVAPAKGGLLPGFEVAGALVGLAMVVFGVRRR